MIGSSRTSVSSDSLVWDDAALAEMKEHFAEGSVQHGNTPERPASATRAAVPRKSCFFREIEASRTLHASHRNCFKPQYVHVSNAVHSVNVATGMMVGDAWRRMRCAFADLTSDDS